MQTLYFLLLDTLSYLIVVDINSLTVKKKLYNSYVECR